MAQAAKDTLVDLLVSAASIYPAALRHGVGYWSEMVVNTSSYWADLVEAALRVARRPGQYREVLADLTETFRRHVQMSGDTFERALLDFNQALMVITLRPQDPPAGPGNERAVNAWQQLADFAATQAMNVQSGQPRPDLEELRRRLDSCLAELRRAESGTGSGRSPDASRPS